MKQFGKILKFELRNFMTNKVFVGVTAFLMVVIAAVMFFPRLTEALDAEQGAEPDAGEAIVMLVASEDADLAARAAAAFPEAFPGCTIVKQDPDAVQEQIRSGAADCAVILNSPTDFTYCVDDLSLYDSTADAVAEVLRKVNMTGVLLGHGMTQDEVTALLETPITYTQETLGTDQSRNFFYTYIMIFALYMVILLYGQMVATNVATEKSSRAMELLITSAKPVSMMFGKVLASCLAGLTQLICIFGTAFVCFNLNKSYWDAGGIVASLFDMPLELLVYMLVFFLLGFLIYAFLYGAVGSTASKLEDINTSVMPITMLFLIAFFVAMFSMTGGSVDSLLMKICSFIPFTSPMVMFTRIAMSVVPPHEILIAIAILIGSVILVGVIAAKIYRVGVLLYGTPPKPAAIIKAIRQA